MKPVLLFAIFFCVIALALSQVCTPTVTTASGPKAPTRITFDTFEPSNWKRENTLAGFGNEEFEWYSSHKMNTYATDGKLHMKPTFVSDIFGEHFLSTGRVLIPSEMCTQTGWNGCDQQGAPDSIIKPVKSSRIDTSNSFRYKYGTAEIRAKNPAGDWLWPALWLYPSNETYGGWPASGEIDLMESRGNRELFEADGVTKMGVEQVGSTIHFGPRWDHNAYYTAIEHKRRAPGDGWDRDFHLYKLVWGPTGLQYFYDNELALDVQVGEGFWERGGFQSTDLPNPWVDATLMAPFDQEFFFIFDLAIGGNYFGDSAINRDYPKPWNNNSPRGATNFWEARSSWEPTWNIGTDDSHLQVDYIRVWAL